MALREPHWSHILTTEALVSDTIRELHDCRVLKNRKPHLVAYPLTKFGSALEQAVCPGQTAKSSLSGPDLHSGCSSLYPLLSSLIHSDVLLP